MPKMMKPVIGGGEMSNENAGHSGGGGEGARTTQSGGDGGARQDGERGAGPQRPEGIHNRGNGPGRESERPIRAKKRGNARGAKGPQWKHAAVRGKENRLDEHPTTEAREHIEALKKQASGDGPP